MTSSSNLEVFVNEKALQPPAASGVAREERSLRKVGTQTVDSHIEEKGSTDLPNDTGTVFPLVRICPYKYGFLKKIRFCTDFFKNTDFWTFFLKRPIL